MNQIAPSKNTSGFVYLIHFADCGKGMSYKVGFASNVIKRARTISSIDGRIELLAWCYSDNAILLEKQIQNQFSGHSHWSCLQKMIRRRICNPRMKTTPFDPAMFSRCIGCYQMSKEAFYLKPTRAKQMIEEFRKNGGTTI